MSKLKCLTIPENIPRQEVYDFVKSNYAVYGEYVNLHRGFAHVVDGMKPSYRRVLLAAKFHGELVKTPKIVADTLQKYHPHGAVSIETLVSTLVRRGMFNKQGNHGAELVTPSKAAASRYTYAGLKSEYKDYFFKFLDFCPGAINEENEWEPHYLINPVPYVLVYGSKFDIGLGAGGRIPAFTFESLIEAYQTQDCNKLVAKYNDIISADFKSLWETGVGKIKATMKVASVWSKDDNQDTVVISGPECGIIPNMNKFDEWLDQGYVWYRDESSTKIGMRVVIGRTNRTRVISDEDILIEAKRCCIFSRKYNMIVNVFGQLKRIGIKDWLDITMSNYEKALAEWRNDRVKVIQAKIAELTYTPEVGKKLLEDKINSVIAKEIGIEEELVKSISDKPMRYLRKKDFGKEIEAQEVKLRETLEVTSEKLIRDFKLNLKFKR